MMSRIKKAPGFMDEIRCDEDDYLVWQWHPAGTRKHDNDREHAIRMGSSLRVRDGSAAVFVYSRGGTSYQDFILGPCDRILDTDNLPVFARLVGLAYAGGTPFQAEVYFVNLARVVQVPFAVPFFDAFDPRFSDLGVPVAVRGALTFHIADCHEFVRLHRLQDFSLDQFSSQVRASVTRYVKEAVANAPADLGVPLVQVERRIGDINDAAERRVAGRLASDFGVEVTGLDISAIELDHTSDGYRQLLAVTRDVASRQAQAEADVRVKDLRDRQRIEAENLEASLRAQREEAQYAQRKATQSQNMGAYQLEQQGAVGVAGAKALGRMGANGATAVGSAGGPLADPAAMVAGMAVGGAVGRNVASAMDGMMGGLGQRPQDQAVAPPPLSVEYHVAVGDRAAGPYALDALASMAGAGTLTRDSLVWKPGMPDWARAGDVPELSRLFGGVGGTTPPPVPGGEA